MTTTAYEVTKYLRTKSLYGEVQLQKLLYYVQGWSLAWSGNAAFSDTIEAWQNGPVVRSVRHFWPTPDPDAIPDSLKPTVDAVYRHYGRYSGSQLIVMTHDESPWIDAWGDRGPCDIGSDPIDRTALLRYFSKMALEGKGPEQPSAPTGVCTEADPEFVQQVARANSKKWRRTLALLAE